MNKKHQGIVVIVMVTFLFVSALLSQTMLVYAAPASTYQSFDFNYSTGHATVYFKTSMINAPVILFLHGFAATNTYYSWMYQPFTDAGYVLVMLEVPISPLSYLTNDNVSDYISTYVAAFNCIPTLEAQPQLAGVANFSEIIAIGHSLGALSALITASTNSQIKAVSAWSPPFDLTGYPLPKPTTFNVPIQIIIGSTENAMYTSAVNYYNTELQAPTKNLTIIQGGNHMQYLDQDMVNVESIVDNILPIVGGETATISVDQQHQEVLNSTLTFLSSTSTNVVQQVATPTFSPVGGFYSSAQNVSIQCTTAGATIRYTVDGSEPTVSSTAYSSSISVNTNMTLKAKAFMTGMTDSNIASATYTFSSPSLGDNSALGDNWLIIAIVGVVAIIAVAGGAVYYFRKRKLSIA